MPNKSILYTTQFGELLMPYHNGKGYTIAIVDIAKNLVTDAIISISKDNKELPTYAPTFSSYAEAVNWLDEHYEELF